MAHFVDDGGEEHGHGGEGHVGAEEHEGREVALGISDRFEHLAEFKPAFAGVFVGVLFFA